MLLRTLLLFLCMSSGLCATLGLFQMQAKDEDMLAQDSPDVLDNVVEASDGKAQDTETTTDDTLNDLSPHVEEGLLKDVMDNNIQEEADKEANEEVDAPVVDGAPTEEVVTDTVTDKTEDVPTVEVKVDEVPINDVPSQDVPVVETKVAEDPIQDQPSQEEDNEIKPVQTEEVQKTPEESYSRWGFNSIRNSFQNMHGYFDSLVELVGGRNGVCEYRCRYGDLPAPRPGYQLPEPNGCSSSLVGFQVNAALDLGIPAMTQCCNQLDSCYDTCGTSKYDCDSSFRSCLHDICSDLKKSLGFGTQVQTCESMADGLFNTVWTLGCRPYMNSQRAACICHEEEKDEL